MNYRAEYEKWCNNIFFDKGIRQELTALADNEAEVDQTDIITDVKRMSFDEGMQQGMIAYIPEQIYTDFVEAVKRQSMLSDDVHVDKNVAIVYSPLNGAFLICEMFAYYQTQGISLLEKLDALYSEFGYCLNTLHSYEFEGVSGFEKMQEIMAAFRGNIPELAGRKVLQCLDYNQGIDGLPKSDVLKFLMEGDCSIVVRPSGTEPKLKAYISVSAQSREEALRIEENITDSLKQYMD